MNPYTLAWNNHTLEIGHRTLIMGIVNVTPDSFSDGGQFHSLKAALAQARRLTDAGADIIDIGGESTRPFADAVPVDEEMDRVIPVIEQLVKHIDVPISIDTTKAVVAEAALQAGAAIINDISAMRLDEGMAAVAAKGGVPVILMHMKGEPRTMQMDPTYENVVTDVRDFLAQAIATCVNAGIRRDKIIIDPGIGFGKTGRHNLELIKHLKDLADLDAPILVGPSRKRFIRDLLKDPSQNDIPPDRPEVETGTQAAVAASVINGAHIVRVHNVANTKAMLDVLHAIIKT
jgi:dihydropteroate synthase